MPRQRRRSRQRISLPLAQSLKKGPGLEPVIEKIEYHNRRLRLRAISRRFLLLPAEEEHLGGPLDGLHPVDFYRLGVLAKPLAGEIGGDLARLAGHVILVFDNPNVHNLQAATARLRGRGILSSISPSAFVSEAATP